MKRAFAEVGIDYRLQFVEGVNFDSSVSNVKLDIYDMRNVLDFESFCAPLVEQSLQEFKETSGEITNKTGYRPDGGLW